MTYRVYIHENGEPVEKAVRNNREDAEQALASLFRGRLEGMRPVYMGDDDYSLYDVFTTDGEFTAAIEWD